MNVSMRWISRIAASVTVILAYAAPLCAQQAPAGPSLPDSKYDSSFVVANRHVTDQNLDKAFDEYTRIKNDNVSSNPQLAAEAVLRAALMGHTLLSTPHTPDFDKLPPEAKEARQSKEQDVARKAHDILKVFKEESKLATTPEALYVLEPHWTNPETHQLVDLKSAVESLIDGKNSSQLNYKVVDKLVSLTGANPAFSYCLALVLIAVIVKTITFPLTLRTYKSQREMQKIQPLLKDLQERYKGKPELNEKMMALYKEHNVNPFASCVPVFVQLPFMYYVYNTIRLYEYHFSHGKFLWIGSGISHTYPAYLATDLSKFDLPLLTIYALSNYLTMKLNPSPDPAQAQQQKSMSIMMTLMFFFMFMKYQWSAAFIFYWLILNFITAFQQYTYIYKPNKLKALDPASTTVTGGSDKAIGAARNATPAQPTAAANRPRPKARKRK